MEPTDNRQGVRRAGIEWLRLLGCFAIVCFHARCPGDRYFLAGLHAFVILTVAMSAAGDSRGSLATFARKRARSLLLPWAFWSLCYAAVKSYISAARGAGALSWWEPAMAFIGPSLHLWFLPFAFTASVAAAAVARARLGGRGAGVWAATGWACVAAGAFWAVNHGLAGLGEPGLPAPIPQYLSVVGDVIFGVALGSVPPATPRAWPRLLGVALPCIAALVVGAVVDGDDIARPAGLAVAVAAAAWAVPSAAGTRLLAWSRLSYGVYLVHPLVALLVHKAWAVLSLDRFAALVDSRWTLAAAVSIGSATATWVVLRTPLRVFAS